MKSLSDVFPKEYVDKRKELFEAEQSRDAGSSYWDVLAELQVYGGFPAVQAVLDDYITIEQANSLLVASRKRYNATIYDIGVASLAGVNGKNFNKIMANYIRGMK